MHFPRTQILAVPPKESSLDDQKKKNKKKRGYEVFTDISVEPAKRKYTENGVQILDKLSDEAVTKAALNDHRNKKLFFPKGSWDHIKVARLVEGLQEFVRYAQELNPRNHTFFIGPNYIKRPEVDDIVNGNPTSPFIYLRLHNLIQAATKLQFRGVTNYTDDNYTTKNGFNDDALIGSIWAANGRLVKEVLDAVDDEETEKQIISNLRNKYRATVSMDFFSKHILTDISPSSPKDKVRYGLTHKLAEAIFKELEIAAKKVGHNIAPFYMIFSSEHDITHESVKRVIALKRSDGNLY